jgi:PTS system nitrogen regulatory IIA component
MNIATLLPAEQILCEPDANSKKRALEILSGLLEKSGPDLQEEEIFNGLLQRERLGTTALGEGVAIPHTRMANLSSPTIAMIKLDKGVDFDAPDQQPVDILFALAVPENSDSNHLEILATLAEMLSDREFVDKLRTLYNCEALYKLLSSWQPSRAA